MAAEDTDLRQQLQRRATGLDAIRQPWVPAWQEVSRFTRYNQTEYLQLASNEGPRPTKIVRTNGKLLSSTAGKAARTLANGMTSGRGAA